MNNRIGIMYHVAMILAFAMASIHPAATFAASPAPLHDGDVGNTPVPIGKTDYLSIPAAAFTPSSQSYNYANNGRYIYVFEAVSKFRAPVYLPHGSIIKRITACFHDDSIAYTGTLKLFHLTLTTGTSSELASASSQTGSGYQLSSTNPDPPIITNSYLYAYWLELTLPPSPSNISGVWGCGVTIEYSHSGNATGILSMAGAAFDHPTYDGYNSGQTQSGGKLRHFEDGNGTHGYYVAQVSLPHGAVVSKMSLYFYDNDDHMIHLYLERTHNDQINQMAYTYSLDYLNKVDVTAISFATIDLINYTYWAYVDLAPANLDLWAVTIEYSVPASDGGKLAISPAAFTHWYEDYDYENHGQYLFHKHTEGGGTDDGSYFAPVYLPQGATVLAFDCYFYDGSVANNAFGVLMRTRLGGEDVMASAITTGHTGFELAIPDPYDVEFNTVDNSLYSYFIYMSLPVTTVHSPPQSGEMVASRIVILYRKNYYIYLPAVKK